MKGAHMGKIKIYAVVCSYIIDGDVINVDLMTVLKRLNMEPSQTWWGSDYNVKRVVQWHFDNCYKVKYLVGVRYIDQNKINFATCAERSEAESTVQYMNDFHDSLFRNLSDEEAREMFSHYGNDYRQQTTKKG